jgi:predicted PhzF superfamily epimerase YddE/YHI9
MTLDMDTYRAGRQKATEAAEAIREALAALGLPERVWASVRPLVTHTGKPYVHIGMIRADAAEKMSEAMRTPADPRPVD